MIILIEGPDGSGKSTLVRALAERLESQGDSVKTFAFPSYDGPIGQFIRSNLFTGDVEVAERAMLPLMIADAVDCDGRVLDYAEQHDVVILDRHSLVSAYAYQLGPWGISGVTYFAAPGMFRALPNIIFILDLPAEEAVSRRKNRGEEENPLYEKDLEYAKNLRSRYLAWAQLAEEAPVVLLDASKPLALVLDELLSHFKSDPKNCQECGHPNAAHEDGECTVSTYNPVLGNSTRCPCG